MIHVTYRGSIVRRVPFQYYIFHNQWIFKMLKSFPMVNCWHPHQLQPVLVSDHSKVHDCTMVDPNSPRTPNDSQHQPSLPSSNSPQNQLSPSSLLLFLNLFVSHFDVILSMFPIPWSFYCHFNVILSMCRIPCSFEHHQIMSHQCVIEPFQIFHIYQAFPGT